MSIDNLINLLIALATIAAVVVAVISLRTGLAADKANREDIEKNREDAEKRRIESLYQSYRREAYMVDVGFGKEKEGEKRTCIVVHNASPTAIRNVKIKVKDKLYGKTTPRPRCNMIPHGVWKIRRGDAKRDWWNDVENDKKHYYWDLPVLLPRGFSDVDPCFAERGQDNYELVEVNFIDTYGNTWRYEYPQANSDDGGKIEELYLVKATDPRLKKYQVGH